MGQHAIAITLDVRYAAKEVEKIQQHAQQN
jgi:hypothetical protein